MTRATLTASLRALEVIRDDDARRLLEAGKPMAAAASIAIIDNAIRATLDLAAAVTAALDGDLAPARQISADVALDSMGILP